MCFLPIYSGCQAYWAYQPGSHRRKVTQDFSSAFLLRCLPYFSREKDSVVPFPRRPGVHVCAFFIVTDRVSTVPCNMRRCQSSTWSRRATKVYRSHHGAKPLLERTGVQTATKSLPGPTTREHRELIGVKTMSFWVRTAASTVWSAASI